EFTRARRGGDEAARQAQLTRYRASQKEMEDARREGTRLFETSQGVKGASDTNYIFLSFVTRYLPAGVVGLVIAVIFSAAMSATSGEINALATVTLVDVYQRHIKPNASDGHYLTVSRLATVFWGCYAIVFAQYGRGLGSLIEAVNMVGSLFYGSLLGVFVLAFFVPRAGGTAAFTAMLVGEAAIFSAFFFTQISFLWYNVIGAVVVVATGIALGGAGDSPARKGA
ncbi:MAG: sodium:solute symporter, partial [Bryobacteraceae bacterium]